MTRSGRHVASCPDQQPPGRATSTPMATNDEDDSHANGNALPR